MRSSSTGEVTGCRMPGLVGAPQPPGVDRDQDVGRAVAALRLDPLDQLVGVALDQIDLDPGLLGERVVQRDVGIVVARRVEIDLLRDRAGRGQREREPDHAGQALRSESVHGAVLDLVLGVMPTAASAGRARDSR